MENIEIAENIKVESIGNSGSIKRRLNGYLYRHFRVNETNYLYIIVALAAGVAAGAFVVGCLDKPLEAEIAVILKNYSAALAEGGAASVKNILYDNILPIMRQYLLLMVCGLTYFALVSGIIVMAAKGFAVGFFVASAVSCLPLKSALLLLLPSVPYQVMSSLLLLAASGVATAHRKMHEKGYVYYLTLGLIFLINVSGVILDMLLKTFLQIM